MSDVLYPIGGRIASLRASVMDRVLKDAFEAGNTMTRNLWAANTFKRRFDLQHMPLTYEEFKYLDDFYTEREGAKDVFWFRDNVNRRGNAKVRFSQPLMEDRGPAVYPGIQVQLEEIAPIRALPGIVAVKNAGGSSPALWWDPNREIWYEDQGAVYKEVQTFDAQGNLYPAVWQGGTALNLAGTLTQWQDYFFNNSEWAKTAINIAALAGAQPASTVFAIVKCPTIASKQVLIGVGAMGAGNALGIAVAADNRIEPWIGGSETWTNARSNNSPNNTWRSVAVTWPAASNNATLYVNAASIGTDANTRNYTAGSASLGAAIDGTLKCNTADEAHLMIFSSALSLAQIKALHNLFAHQYGMSTVA